MNDLIPMAGDYGTVILNDWWTTPEMRKVQAFTGRLHLVKMSDFGMTAGSADRATWGVIVQGPSERMVVLGCQLRGVHLHAEGRQLHGETWVLP